MQKCPYCGRWFKNLVGLKTHIAKKHRRRKKRRR